MKKNIIYLLVIASILISAPRLMAWSDDVSGVLMLSPRGGGGIPDEDVQSAINGPETDSSGESPALIEWE